MMDRKQQLMQEALDGLLSPQEETELREELRDNPASASEYNRLQDVETVLRDAPQERAPERLALTIMARIAEAVKQQEKLTAESDELAEAAVNVAVQLVTVATLPLLIGASTLILNAQADPELIDEVLRQVSTMMILVIDVLKVLLEQAQNAYAEDPELALAMLALIPPTMLTLVRHLLGEDDDDELEIE